MLNNGAPLVEATLFISSKSLKIVLGINPA